MLVLLQSLDALCCLLYIVITGVKWPLKSKQFHNAHYSDCSIELIEVQSKAMTQLCFLFRFGDKLSNCPAYTTADCVDAAIAEECCQLCGPTPPSSTTSTTMSTTVTTVSRVTKLTLKQVTIWPWVERHGCIVTFLCAAHTCSFKILMVLCWFVVGNWIQCHNTKMTATVPQQS